MTANRGMDMVHYMKIWIVVFRVNRMEFFGVLIDKKYVN